MKNKHVQNQAFTLIELLVVITIIAVLAALVVPGLQTLREKSNEIKCANNLRELMTGFTTYAADNAGLLPGGWKDRAAADPKRSDWLFGKSSSYKDAPQKGTLFPYVGREMKLYRCPSLPTGKFGSGVGSNGRFDYAVNNAFSGARLSNINATSELRDPKAKKPVIMPTPVIVEEDAKFWINRSPNTEGGHGNEDKMAHTHRGGSYYASSTGSVHWYNEPIYLNSLAWWSVNPNGSALALGKDLMDDQWSTQ